MPAQGKIIMATEKIRVGIIGANVHYGWGSGAHIPALRALTEFEITAVCTSRQETADETAKHFGISLAFADPFKMVQHPRRGPRLHLRARAFSPSDGDGRFECRQASLLRMAACGHYRAGQQMHDLAARKGVRHMVGLQARGARAINRARDLVAEGYVGKVLSCTMIVTTPNWGTDFTLSRAYLADRSTGATLMTIPGVTQLTPCAFASASSRRYPASWRLSANELRSSRPARRSR